MNLYYSLIYTTSLLGCDIIFIRFLFQIIILISRSGRSFIERFGLVLTDFLEFYWEVNFWCHWYASRPSMAIRLVHSTLKSRQKSIGYTNSTRTSVEEKFRVVFALTSFFLWVFLVFVLRPLSLNSLRRCVRQWFPGLIAVYSNFTFCARAISLRKRSACSEFSMFSCSDCFQIFRFFHYFLLQSRLRLGGSASIHVSEDFVMSFWTGEWRWMRADGYSLALFLGNVQWCLIFNPHRFRNMIFCDLRLALFRYFCKKWFIRILSKLQQEGT
jgi:hypothetical protein